MTAADLLDAWSATMSRLGASPDSAPARSLLARYGEPHRHYHGVAHLRAMLTTVDDLAGHAADPDAVRLAAWFHDAVYDPRAPDNEERSAELAVALLMAAGVPAVTGERVASLVRGTAGHDPREDDRDGHVLCDADLAILATAPAIYARYVAGVRREYEHVSAADWHAGRAAVLRGLLAPPRLFRTPAGAEWEEAARRNISRELAGLVDPSAGAARRR